MKRTTTCPRPPASGRIEAAAVPGQFYLGTGEPLEITAEAAPDGQPSADGQPAGLKKFKGTVYTGVAMKLEGFFHPVVVDLAGVKVANQRLPVLRQHDPERIVGHTEAVEVSERRVALTGLVSGVGSAAAEAVALAGNGFPWQASIGSSTERIEFVDRGSAVKVNGRNFNGPVLVVRASTLREVSLVPIGADTGTSVAVAAHQRTGEAAMTFEQWLQAKGFDGAALSDVQRAALQAAYNAEQTPPPVAPPVVTPPAAGTPPVHTGTLDEVVAAARAQQERRTRITEIAAQVITEQPETIEVVEALARQAIEGNWDVDRFELGILRARRPNALAVHHIIPREPQLTDDVVAAAVCVAGGLADIEEHFDERTLEAAHKKWRHGLDLAELVLTAAPRNGYRGLNLRSNLQGALKAAFQPDVRAGVGGPSTYSLPNIFSNVANKFMAMGFNAIDSAWRQIAKIRSVNDFKQITSVTLTGHLTYEKVPASGEIKHGEVGERTYSNKADTYARMLGIDRRDLINDDLGALSDAGVRLGRGGALALNKEFWSVFLNNATFFAAGNNNIVTPAAALSLASLQSADAVFRLQTDPDGQPLGIFPAILLVPPALRITALNLMNSTVVVASQQGATPALSPGGNAFAGAYQVVSSPYMQNTSFTGNSATAHYLLASPQELPVIEVCFLSGVETPTVETAEMEINMLGIAMRGFHDFGVALQEFRAGVRNAGA